MHSLLSPSLGYCFIDPSIPCTKCFCRPKKINTIGSVAMTIAVIITPYSGKYADDIEEINNVTVCLSSVWMTIRGHK